MGIVASFTPKGLTVEKYDKSVRRLEEAGLLPAEGMAYHAASPKSPKSSA